MKKKNQNENGRAGVSTAARIKYVTKWAGNRKTDCLLIGIYFVATLVNYVQRNIEWRKRVGRQRQCVLCNVGTLVDGPGNCFYLR